MNPSYVKPDPEAVFDTVKKHYGLPLFETRKDRVGNLNEPFWAGLYRGEHDILFEPRENEFFEYDPGIGIFRPLTTHLIRDRLAERLREIAREKPQYDGLTWLTGSRHLGGVVAHLKGQTQKEDAFKNEGRFIHVLNGVLDLSAGNIRLRPFSPTFISRSVIPIAYDPKARCVRFTEELLGSLSAEDRLLIQKFFGLFLLGRNLAQKMLILHGIGDTGKSTLAIVAKGVIGVQNCAELRTQLLAERFEIGSYVGKHLLIGADVAPSFLNSKGAYRLKGLTGGDLLDCEKKNANFRYQLTGEFNVLITSNSRLTLHLNGDRGAWRRRLAIVEYEAQRTSKTIPEFAHLLISEEGTGILNFAAEGLLMLWSDIQKYGAIQLTKIQTDRVDALLDESDGLRLFLRQNVGTTTEVGQNLSTAEIVERYAGYCSKRGWNMTISQTERDLPDLMLELFQVAKSNNLKRGEATVRGFRGVRFRSANDEERS